MALSDIALCSRALLKLGAQPVASLEEGSAEAEIAANLYPGVRDAVLADRVPRRGVGVVLLGGLGRRVRRPRRAG